MTAEPDKLRELFLAALKIPAGERDAFLREACAGAEELRGRVELLIQAHEELGSIVLPAEVQVDPATDKRNAGSPGTTLGPYKLLEPIGEGGMGTVWMAQQTEPVRRLVAVKLIKAGMDSKQVIARFEAERQALALMDHTNIARVLDGGTTADGRPYFVMDLVKGVPITRFCDEHRLTTRQRLELFVPVCQAIQHAHQKGVIHRDVKPSNVLVALYDDNPVPKVIDFGVAKAAGQKLSDATLQTGFGAVVGTVEYMSPEQASFNALDIDTRSDIYSLGVVLYELLTGSPPFTRKEMEKGGVLEMLRVIREQEPTRPSTKLSTADGLPTLAANRGTDPGKLTRLVRGELDWIVLKALEKDRGRRYATANDLALDVQRYLADETVLACPPSAGYRLRKFVRRNQRTLLTAAALVAMLLAVLGAVGWAAWDRAAREEGISREQALQMQRLETQVELALDDAVASYRLDRIRGAQAEVKRAEGLATGRAIREDLSHRTRRLRAELAMAERLERIRVEKSSVKEQEMDWRGADADYADAFRQFGLSTESAALADTVEHVRSSTIKAHLVAALDDWMQTKWQAGYPGAEPLLFVLDRVDPDSWRGRLRHAMRDRKMQVLEELARDRAVLLQSPVTVYLLAFSLGRNGRGPLAIEILRQAQRRTPNDFWLNWELAHLLVGQNPPAAAEAVGFYRAALAQRPDNPYAMVNLGYALQRDSRLAEAEAEYRAALQVKAEFAPAHRHLAALFLLQDQPGEAEKECSEALRINPEDAGAYAVLGGIHRSKREWPEVAAAYRKVLELRPQNGNALGQITNALLHQKKDAEAEAECRAALERHPDFVVARLYLGGVMLKQGKPVDAEVEFREVIRLKPEHGPAHHSLGLLLWEQGKAADAELSIQEAVRLSPDAVHIRHWLGTVRARTGQWEKASDAFERCLDLRPAEDKYWYRCAILRLQAGDSEGYRRACRILLERFGKTKEPELAARIAGISALVPGATGDPKPLRELAEGALARGKKRSSWPVLELMMALTEHRAGRHAEALERLNLLPARLPAKLGQGCFEAVVPVLQALVYHRLEQPEQARRAYARGRATLSRVMPDVAKGQTFDEDWIEWLHCLALYREAKALFEK